MRDGTALFDDGSKLSCTILDTDELNVSEDEILSKAAKEFMQKFCEYGAKEIKKYINLTTVLECPRYTTIKCTVDFAKIPYNYAFVTDVLKQIPPKDLKIILNNVYGHNNPKPVDILYSPVDIPDQAAVCFAEKVMNYCIGKKIFDREHECIFFDAKKGCSLNFPANKCDLETIKELKKYRKRGTV